MQVQYVKEALVVKKRKKAKKMDLLSGLKVRPKWVPYFLSDRSSWLVFSGKWKIESQDKILYLRDPGIKSGENISIVGSRSWSDFNLQVKLKFLTDSMKPPEGGAIVYFLFRNLKNYYSIHFCLCKQKAEFIKRRRGVWGIVEEQEYDFDKQTEYSVEISTHSGIHRCQIDGINIFAVKDHDISRGCIGIGVKYCDIEFSRVSLSLGSCH